MFNKYPCQPFKSPFQLFQYFWKLEEDNSQCLQPLNWCCQNLTCHLIMQGLRYIVYFLRFLLLAESITTVQLLYLSELQESYTATKSILKLGTLTSYKLQHPERLENVNSWDFNSFVVSINLRIMDTVNRQLSRYGVLELWSKDDNLHNHINLEKLNRIVLISEHIPKGWGSAISKSITEYDLVYCIHLKARSWVYLRLIFICSFWASIAQLWTREHIRICVEGGVVANGELLI